MQYSGLMKQWRNCQVGLGHPATLTSETQRMRSVFSNVLEPRPLMSLYVSEIHGAFSHEPQQQCWAEIATGHCSTWNWLARLQKDEIETLNEIAGQLRLFKFENRIYVAPEQLHIAALLRCYFGAQKVQLHNLQIQQVEIDQAALASFRLARKLIRKKPFNHLNIELDYRSPASIEVNNLARGQRATLRPLDCFELLYGIKGKKRSKFYQLTKRPGFITRWLFPAPRFSN